MRLLHVSILRASNDPKPFDKLWVNSVEGKGALRKWTLELRIISNLERRLSSNANTQSSSSTYPSSNNPG
jgi:hypothetical protein